MAETRRSLIQRIQRVIYNDYPEHNATITEPLVNRWINDAISVAAKNNYIESIKIDGIEYINNAFYTTFKNIDIVEDEINIFKFNLPTLPLAVGRNEGIASIEFKSAKNNISYPAIPLTTNQVGYTRGMRDIPNKVLYWNENSVCYALTQLPLNEYKAKVRMISGGGSNDLDAPLNVPNEFIPQIIEYCLKYLMIERNNKQDLSNDGRDNAPTQ